MPCAIQGRWSAPLASCVSPEPIGAVRGVHDTVQRSVGLCHGKFELHVVNLAFCILWEAMPGSLLAL